MVIICQIQKLCTIKLTMSFYDASGNGIAMMDTNTTRRQSIDQARTQDFEKGGSEYHVAVRPRRGGGCGRGMYPLLREV